MAVSDQTRQALVAAGAQITVVSSEASSYAGYVAPKDLNAVAAVPGVIAVSEVLQTRRPDPGVHTAAPKAKAAAGANACAPTTSLADTQLKAALARTNFGVDGTGIKVGVLSSSYAATTSPTSAVNLAGVNLAGADLAGVDFTGVDFTGANLTGANLTGANLTGVHAANVRFVHANLRHANLRGAKR